MNIDQSKINIILDKYIKFTDNISKKNDYPNNIQHLLYLIIPAFVIKYGSKYEGVILKCFEDVPLYINSEENKYITAMFCREMKHKPNHQGYYTKKYVVLNQYKNIDLIDLLDNIIHEYNHGVNSMINEIIYDEEEVSMRTGLSYITYSIHNLNKVIRKSNDITLEEIINVKQTEDIIDIIKSFNKYEINNLALKNTLYSISSSISEKYVSKAYFVQSVVCRELMRSKTFIPTIENLRLNGNVDNIEEWFNDITGDRNAYNKLVNLLDEILEDEKKLLNKKHFKKLKINKIKSKINDITEIINKYENNCIYK